ncbi:hypothetical protein KILIM_126_00030 [Kineosphaera limosa NBRC 100340]|uniref:Uncharacterized protein n=1 Tax=Kineosphaera limosa NBRC 100340 TaxID=1184609 RepID=K6WGC4_9MICO|nr:hypothetical protein KILIM_126_00030 [Kineosphaera limosa NBRC 100340]
MPHPSLESRRAASPLRRPLRSLPWVAVATAPLGSKRNAQDVDRPGRRTPTAPSADRCARCRALLLQPHPSAVTAAPRMWTAGAADGKDWRGGPGIGQSA